MGEREQDLGEGELRARVRELVAEVLEDLSLANCGRALAAADALAEAATDMVGLDITCSRCRRGCDALAAAATAYLEARR